MRCLRWLDNIRVSSVEACSFWFHNRNNWHLILLVWLTKCWPMIKVYSPLSWNKAAIIEYSSLFFYSWNPRFFYLTVSFILFSTLLILNVINDLKQWVIILNEITISVVLLVSRVLEIRACHDLITNTITWVLNRWVKVWVQILHIVWLYTTALVLWWHTVLTNIFPITWFK